MAREYGRVKSAFWDSDRIKKCSPPAKMLGLYLLTSSHTNAIGCFRLPLAYMADDTGLEPKALERAFAELREAGFVQWCERMPFVWLPNYLKHNAPENPNVWRKCVKELESLPGEITAISSIADQLAEIALEPRMRKEGSQNRVSDAEITVLERYRNGIETSSKGSRPYPCPIPEPIPEPPSLRSGESAPQAGAPPSKPKPVRGTRWSKEDQVPSEWVAEAEMRRVENGLTPINLRLEAERFVNYWASKAGVNATKVDWHLTWMNWALDDKKHGQSHGAQQRKPTATDSHLAGIRELIEEKRRAFGG